VILQIPMESFDGGAAPGPHMLHVSADATQNLDDLNWLMSRFTGYAGVAAFLGGKFTADAGAVAPVLRRIASLGLFYFDDTSSTQSVVPSLLKPSGLDGARADVVLDAMQTPEAVDAALARLEAMAREKGSAVGVASGLPATVERVARFTRGLERKGLLLVPLSATVNTGSGLTARAQ
jgi:hypothetical protein